MDTLVDSTNDFAFTGRPGLIGTHCNPSSTAFSPYGRIDDVVHIGVNDDPVADVAPFEIASWADTIKGDGTPDSMAESSALTEMVDRMDEWLVEACKIAGERRVRVEAIFFGANNNANKDTIDLLEDCVDAAGGQADSDEVYVAATAAALESSFKELFEIKRNLRFVD